MSQNIPAILAFEDGSVFRGRAFGALRTVLGEAVFNTSMSGYQEIITDPSYYGQIVTMTAPQIGNYGINSKDSEAAKPNLVGLVIHELSPIPSNWRSEQTLNHYLEQNDIPGIEGVDTRTITKKTREAGVLKACLSTEGISEEEAVKRAREWKGLEGIDCLKEVSCKKPYELKPTDEELTPFTVEGTHLAYPKKGSKVYHIVAFDFGAKRSIFKKLAQRGFRVTVVPANTTANEVRSMNPDGIFLSNGPGDPAGAPYTHTTVAELLPDYPMFGICMGHQIITHALGAKTFKLKFGHRGGNHPVKNLETGKISITAQNHGYATKAEDLEACGAIITEINLNDNTVSGLRHKKFPVFSVQYHPEAAPGPNDADYLFDEFYKIVHEHSPLTAS